MRRHYEGTRSTRIPETAFARQNEKVLTANFWYTFFKWYVLLSSSQKVLFARQPVAITALPQVVSTRSYRGLYRAWEVWLWAAAEEMQEWVAIMWNACCSKLIMLLRKRPAATEEPQANTHLTNTNKLLTNTPFNEKFLNSVSLETFNKQTCLRQVTASKKTNLHVETLVLATHWAQEQMTVTKTAPIHSGAVQNGKILTSFDSVTASSGKCA